MHPRYKYIVYMLHRRCSAPTHPPVCLSTSTSIPSSCGDSEFFVFLFCIGMPYFLYVKFPPDQYHTTVAPYYLFSSIPSLFAVRLFPSRTYSPIHSDIQFYPSLLLPILSNPNSRWTPWGLFPLAAISISRPRR
ncbi:hypothetical protein K438DRAFT_996356 [Mycena galopus ATCC 62051]|nr:hypothetical protein K438DRAFT_996356 [Mycena galopus ATCC 62051]